MVKILVGPQQKIFHVHKRLLSQSCAYFRAALGGEFKESVNDEIRLPEHQPHLFNHFVEWVYSKKVQLPGPLPGGAFKFRNKEHAHAHNNETWTLFSRLYLLAQYFQCPAFDNDVLKCAPSLKESKTSFYEPPDPSIIVMIYDNIITGCALRRYLVDLYVWRLHEPFTDRGPLFNQYLASLPAQCILDVAQASMRRVVIRNVSPFKKEYPDCMQFFQD